MGKKKFKGNRKKKNGDGTKDRDQNGNQGTYASLVKKNEAFEQYYKAQDIVKSDEEFEILLNTLREPLPACE